MFLSGIFGYYAIYFLLSLLFFILLRRRLQNNKFMILLFAGAVMIGMIAPVAASVLGGLMTVVILAIGAVGLTALFIVNQIKERKIAEAEEETLALKNDGERVAEEKNKKVNSVSVEYEPADQNEIELSTQEAIDQLIAGMTKIERTENPESIDSKEITKEEVEEEQPERIEAEDSQPMEEIVENTDEDILFNTEIELDGEYLVNIEQMRSEEPLPAFSDEDLLSIDDMLEEDKQIRTDGEDIEQEEEYLPNNDLLASIEEMDTTTKTEESETKYLSNLEEVLREEGLEAIEEIDEEYKEMPRKDESPVQEYDSSLRLEDIPLEFEDEEIRFEDQEIEQEEAKEQTEKDAQLLIDESLADIEEIELPDLDPVPVPVIDSHEHMKENADKPAQKEQDSSAAVGIFSENERDQVQQTYLLAIEAIEKNDYEEAWIQLTKVLSYPLPFSARVVMTEDYIRILKNMGLYKQAIAELNGLLDRMEQESRTDVKVYDFKMEIINQIKYIEIVTILLRKNGKPNLPWPLIPRHIHEQAQEEAEHSQAVYDL